MGVRQMNTPRKWREHDRWRNASPSDTASQLRKCRAGRPDRRSPHGGGLGRGELEGEHPCRARASGLRPEPGDPRREDRCRGRGEEDRRRRRDHDRKHLGRQPGEGVRGRDRRQGRRDRLRHDRREGDQPGDREGQRGRDSGRLLRLVRRAREARIEDRVRLGRHRQGRGNVAREDAQGRRRQERRDARVRPGRHEQGRPGRRRDLQGPQRRDQGGRRHPEVGRHPADELGSRQGPRVRHRRADREPADRRDDVQRRLDRALRAGRR